MDEDEQFLEIPPLPPHVKVCSFKNATEAFRRYGFPQYEGVTCFHEERIYSVSGHALSWVALATSDLPTAVVAYYRARLGQEGFTAEVNGGSWRLPPEQPERELEVMSIFHPRLQAHRRAAPPTAQTAILLFEFLR